MNATHTPWRDTGVTTGFAPTGRQRFCSHACRQAAYRRRHDQTPAPIELPPPRRPDAATIYTCPSCDARYLGEQRCPECNVFCRRIGPGGTCPHCDEAGSVEELMSP